MLYEYEDPDLVNKSKSLLHKRDIHISWVFCLFLAHYYYFGIALWAKQERSSGYRQCVVSDLEPSLTEQKKSSTSFL